MSQKNYYDLFGLSEKLNIDAKDLQKRFYALSKAVHPDFHQTATGAEQAASLDASSELNQAFLTLKDRDKRLTYVITQYLGDLTDAEKKQTPPELLMQLMEIREKLEAFKHGKDDALKSDLAGDSDALQHTQRSIDQAIDDLMTKFDATEAPDAKRQTLAEIRKLMLRKNYLRSLITTIQTELNPSEL
ncbi:MAG: hypothetical protein HY22_00420 [[Candidatus Thermochlorobacteriaceae] bacterium GBChlB]|nr:MAG: hypothetical protein HY22_00420 [[Candidatus Thermochlorobacteriaceae] bacterium GBChlB]